MYALEVIVAQNKVGDARAKTTPLAVVEKKRYTVEVVSNETQYWEVEAGSEQEAMNNYMDGKHKDSKFHGDDVCVIKEEVLTPAVNQYKHRYPQMHESVLEFECDGCMEVVPDSEYDSDNKKCKDCV